MLYYEFLNLTHNYSELFKFLCDKKVVRDRVRCPRCNVYIQCNIEKSFIISCAGKYYKQIRNKRRKRQTCTFKISIFNGTWFSQANLNIQKICRFIAYFMLLNSPRQLFLEQELSLATHTVVDWINFCRELLAQWLKDNDEQIGGLNKIVEIDEVKFGRSKYNRGRIISGQWLFGGIERDTSRIFVVSVRNRTAETLTSIIRHRILPGTTIYSDCWRAYSNLKNYGYIHKTVNHKNNFLDPDTKVHTQNIERVWRDIRGMIPRYGTVKYHYEHYLAEIMFKRQFQYHDRLNKFFEIMAKFYPIDDNITINNNE
ncbi:hypothetical protein ALC62_04155 [Cyphomyrmex costatus]|uniref:ISXO2-like transposase domain-containing protein n=1 Tax=Cyphomyrmex costatus TaxID=456900 RepID=A0A151K2C0_9HYME|nr:hypothetical protein ALC62_04155 [Cyphomyrmex costatus]